MPRQPAAENVPGGVFSWPRPCLVDLPVDQAYQNILSRFPGQRILVLGDVMLDEYLWGFVRRISQEAPVPVVDLHKRSYVPGGAANTAANLAGLQAEVYLVGIRGSRRDRQTTGPFPQ